MTFAGAVRSSVGRHAALVAMALAVTFVVYRTAWIADDALITFRYVWNLLHGYGAVFNVGERVQGYTHPLWFALLAAATLVTRDEVYAAVGLGLALTFATVVVLGSRLGRAARDPTTGLFATALVLVTFATSDAWRSFQTSGLEGALSTFLVVCFVVVVLGPAPATEAPPWQTLLGGSLLVTCRPDFALLVVPAGALAAWSAWRDRRTRSLRPPLLALAPLASFVLSWLYYGDPLPNTGAAKIGMFTFIEGIHQGLIYFRDWLTNEPVNAFLAFVALIFGMLRLRARQEQALLSGIVVYAVYLVVVGGDFMRGRLLLPVFVACITVGAVALARSLALAWSARATAAASAGIALLTFAAFRAAPEQTRALNEGIVNERLFYLPAHSLSAYVTTHRLEHNEQFDFVAAYLATCGSVTLRSESPGAIGYYLGPQLTMIDKLGLTDRVIAHLPRAYLRAHPPRPGHPYRNLPIAYLAKRGDVSLLPDWEDAMRRRDCTLPARLKELETDTSLTF